jgi:hypothetical protein
VDISGYYLTDRLDQPTKWTIPAGTLVGVGGFFLTDNLNNPTRWTIPLNTTIPAGGTLLFWADGETNEGPLHTSFRLDASGEEIGLFDRDGFTLLDSVVFGGQFADVSTGRLVAPGDPWMTFPTPTPGSPNDPPAVGGYLEYRGVIPVPVRPTLGGSGVPRVGAQAAFEITRGPASSTGLLALAVQPLHADIPGLGTVLVHPLGLGFIPFSTDPRGETTVKVPIPAASALAGVRFFAQAVAYEGVAARLSGGLVARIGP